MAKPKTSIYSIEDAIAYLKKKKAYAVFSSVSEENISIVAEHILNVAGPGIVSHSYGIIHSYLESASFASAAELPSVLVFLDSKGRKTGNTLDKFVSKYGKIEGENRYLLSRERMSAAASLRNGKSAIYTGAIANGMSEEEALNKVACAQRASVESRKIKTSKKREIDPLFTKKSSKFSPLYSNFSSEFTIEDQRILVSSTLGKGRGEHLSSEVDRRSFYMERRGAYTYPSFQRAWYSKESCVFFEKLAARIDISPDDMYYGTSKNGEWWIPAQNNKFYFVDFYIKSLRFGIEYQGIGFHPKSIDNWPRKSGLVSETCEEKWNYDRNKEIALRSVMTLCYVWSDEDHCAKLDEFCRIIENLKGS